MPGKTKIEWADYSSNPLKATYEAGPFPLNGGHTVMKRGHACVKISEGCTHCWASGFNKRLGTGLEYTVTNMEKATVFLDEAELARMRKFNPKPRTGFKNGRSRAVVFPCDMTDLFGEWVKDEWIERIFSAMDENQNVDWFVLTKRTDQMLKFLAERNNRSSAPSRNIYIGCSIENQQRANERRGAMDAIAWLAWNTWASYEPALGPVDWRGWEFLNGLICGGESGKNARPMHPEWARLAQDFCACNDISYFFKQWGEWAPITALSFDATESTTFKHKPLHLGDEVLFKVGKGRSLAVLDGVEWKEMPGSEAARR